MIQDLLTNYALICGICAWVICQGLKFFISGIRYHQWDFRNFLIVAGGMPSSHTSTVVAVSVTAGLREGFSSTLFAVSLVFACVVMRDAAGVRRETGKQGKMINEILSWFAPPTEEEIHEMKEKVGHSPLEVAVGAIIGVICAVVFWLIFPAK